MAVKTSEISQEKRGSAPNVCQDAGRFLAERSSASTIIDVTCPGTAAYIGRTVVIGEDRGPYATYGDAIFWQLVFEILGERAWKEWWDLTWGEDGLGPNGLFAEANDHRVRPCRTDHEGQSSGARTRGTLRCRGIDIAVAANLRRGNSGKIKTGCAECQLRKDELLYYSDSTSSPDRGFVEMHITNQGTRLVKGIYNFDWIDIPILTIRVRPTGRMTVK